MRKIVVTIGFILILQSTAVMAENFVSGKTLKCFDLQEKYPKRWEEVTDMFIENPARETIFQTCVSGGRAYILIREENTDKPSTVRAGIYFFRTKKGFIEPTKNPPNVLCQLDKHQTSMRKITYLCYNPTVAASQTPGTEYSFYPFSNLTKKRGCIVYFSGNKEKECEKMNK